jgi:Transposase DDE domain group 1
MAPKPSAIITQIARSGAPRVDVPAPATVTSPYKVAFYNKRGTCEQWIKEGKGAIRWTRLSCRSFSANAVRLQLHALAYNLGNFLRTLATPDPIKDWSLKSLKEKVVSHGRLLPSRWPAHRERAVSCCKIAANC